MPGAAQVEYIHGVNTIGKSADALGASFAYNLKPGMIVLLHDGGMHASTAQEVHCMLDTALARAGGPSAQ